MNKDKEETHNSTQNQGFSLPDQGFSFCISKNENSEFKRKFFSILSTKS